MVLKGLLGQEECIVALGFVVHCFEEGKGLNTILNEDEITELKRDSLNKYISECILSKEAPSEWILREISQNLLSHIVSEEDFKEILLPACQKAILRSPETSMQVCY